MQRVAIIGPSGAGKSTLARELSRLTGIDVTHLDQLFWRADWSRAPREEWLRSLHDVIAQDRWIVDGNHGIGKRPEEDARFDRADTIIFVELPRWRCIARVLRRVLQHRGRVRPDMSEGCPERLDLQFLRWIWSYPRDLRPRIDGMLAGLDPAIDVVHLGSRRQLRAFLETLAR